MTKEDWIEVISLSSKNDGLDIILIVLTAISAIGVLISAIYAAVAASAARKATDLNLKMYNEQKEKEEKMFLPRFDVSTFMAEDELMVVSFKDRKLINIFNVNCYAIEPKGPDGEESELVHKDSEFHFTFKQNFKGINKFEISIVYDTEEGKTYATNVIIFRLNPELNNYLDCYVKETIKLK